MNKIISICFVVIIIITLTVFFKKENKKTKEFEKKISNPGNKVTIDVKCTFTNKQPVYLEYSDFDDIEREMINPFFKKELTNRGISFKHFIVKDLGFTWVDKDNKIGFNKYEIEYWDW